MVPITSLSKLCQQLQRTSEPFHLLNMYIGKDWQKIVSPNSNTTTIWKNDYLDLRLRSWKTGQPKIYRNNYSTIHTKVLDGKFLAKMKLKNQNKDEEQLEFIQYLHKDDYYTFHPFSSVLLNPLEYSVTLQLYYYHHLY
jgi:hypothetical protein